MHKINNDTTTTNKIYKILNINIFNNKLKTLSNNKDTCF